MLTFLTFTGFAVAGLVLVTTLLPLWRTSLWWVRALDFPRLQIAFLAAAALALLMPVLLAGDRIALAAAACILACIAWQASWIWGFLPHGRVSVPAASPPREGAPRLRLLIANVLQTNRRAADLVRLVREADPDLVLAVETDRWWAEKLQAGLGRDWPHVVAQPLDNTYGMILLSRLELQDVEVRFRVEDDIPSISARLVLGEGATVRFYGVHPRPPRPDSDTDDRDAELLLVAREAKERAGAAIVAGDLNDVGWSHSTRLFQKISGLLDPRRGRGFYSTFHAGVPFLRWPLDHIFHSAEFRLVKLRRLAWFGSDHFPVFAELAWQPEAAAAVETPVAAPEERREAREKIAAAV